MANAFDDPFLPEMQDISRQRKMADILREQSMQAAPQGQVVGGRFIKPHFTQHLAKMLQGFNAGAMGREADEREKALHQSRAQDRSAAIAEALQTMQGKPEYTTQPDTDERGIAIPQRTLPAVPGDRKAAFAALGRSNDPSLQQLALAEALKAPKEAEPYTLKPGETRFGPNNTQVASLPAAEHKAQSVSNVARLIAERDALPANDPNRKIYDNAIRKESETAKQITPTVHVSTGPGQGKAPSGYRYTKTGDLEAIPGGPADQKKQGALNADTASMTSAESALLRLSESANGLMRAPGLKGITGLRGAIPNIPGSEAANAQASLETLKSQVAFGVLQAMRDASKTGGALGAVSEKELMLLQNNLAALDKAQSFEQFQKELGNITKYAEEARGRLRNAYNMKHGGQAGESTGQSPNGGAKFLGFE